MTLDPAQTDPFQILGTVLEGKYRVEQLVGEGGFGVVYAGTHLVLGQRVAIKCLKPVSGNVEAERHATELFLREARLLFGLTHPSIVRLYDAGQLHQGQLLSPYVVLELIEGRGLDEEIAMRVASGAMLSPAELLAIFEPVLEGLHAAHAQGIVHRDLKPSNVMVVRSGAGLSGKLVDFGIARLGAPVSLGARTGSTGFTAAYGAPEQWDPRIGPVGPSTDVFSAGLTLAEACTGQQVLDGSTPAQLLAQIMNPVRRSPVARCRPDLPGSVDAIVQRATRLNPVDRYGSAREMLDALRTALTVDVAVNVAFGPHGVSSGPPPAAGMIPAFPPAPTPGIPSLGASGGVARTVLDAPTPSHGSTPPGGSGAGWGLGVGSTPPGGSGAGRGSGSGAGSGSGSGAGSGAGYARQVMGSTPPAMESSGPMMVHAAGGVVVAPGYGRSPVYVVPAAQASSKSGFPWGVLLGCAGILVAAAVVILITIWAVIRGRPLWSEMTCDPSGNRPTVTTSKVMVSQTEYTEMELMRAVEPHFGELRACYDEALAKEPCLQGEVQLMVSTSETGQVTSVMLGAMGLQKQRLTACVEDRVMKWKLPPSHSKAPTSFMYWVALKR